MARSRSTNSSSGSASRCSSAGGRSQSTSEHSDDRASRRSTGSANPTSQRKSRSRSRSARRRPVRDTGAGPSHRPDRPRHRSRSQSSSSSSGSHRSPSPASDGQSVQPANAAPAGIQRSFRLSGSDTVASVQLLSRLERVCPGTDQGHPRMEIAALGMERWRQVLRTRVEPKDIQPHLRLPSKQGKHFEAPLVSKKVTHLYGSSRKTDEDRVRGLESHALLAARCVSA